MKVLVTGGTGDVRDTFREAILGLVCLGRLSPRRAGGLAASVVS